MDPYEDDHDYAQWMQECWDECSCCLKCADVPCAGVTAGGFCDMLCDCDQYDE